MKQRKQNAMFAFNTHGLYTHARGLGSWQALAGEGRGRHFTPWERQTLKELKWD